MSMASGNEIPIEERARKEITHHGGKQMAPDAVLVENPAFDVTPAKYVTGIITERGVAKAPYPDAMKELASRGSESLVK